MKKSLVLFFFVALFNNVIFTQWVQSNGTNYITVYALTEFETNIFAGAMSGSGVLVSTDNGTSFTSRNNGLTNTEVHALAKAGTNLFAGTYGGVFLSSNSGSSWAAANIGLPANIWVQSLAVLSTNIFAGTGTYNSGVFLSTNNGTNWSPVNSGLANLNINALAVSGSSLFAGTYGGIFLSNNYGISWTAANTGLPANTVVYAFTVSGTNLFAGTNAGVFLSTNNGTNWVAVNTGLTNTIVWSLIASEINQPAGKTVLFAGTNTGIFLSTNNGSSWTAVNTGLPANTPIYAFTVSGTNIFAGSWNKGVWKRPLSELITSIKHILPALPAEYSLLQNHPNPFNPGTIIKYEIPNNEAGGFLTLKIYDILGRVVETLVNEAKPASRFSVEWNASKYPSGI